MSNLDEVVEVLLRFAKRGGEPLATLCNVCGSYNDNAGYGDDCEFCNYTLRDANPHQKPGAW